MAAVMLFLQQTTGKTERHTHFCMPLEPVFTRDCGGRVHFSDEPTGALDSATSRDILVLLEEVNRKYKTTMLIVTHNNSIKNMVDQVIYLKDGQIKKNYRNEQKVPAAELEDL